MSNTHTVPATAADPDVAAATAQFLSPVVVGLTALSVNGKQAHWNVRGTNFIAIHELIDTVVDHAREWSDDAAERIVALGLPIDGRLSTVAEKSTSAVRAGFTQWQQTITDLISDIDAVLVDLQAAIDGLDEIDLTSQDLAIEVKRGLEKDRWFLFAHLAE